MRLSAGIIPSMPRVLPPEFGLLTLRPAVDVSPGNSSLHNVVS